MSTSPTLVRLVAALQLVLLAPLPAAAQDLPLQSEYYVDGAEVDLYRGAFLHSHKDIVSGPSDGEGRIEYVRGANELDVRVDIEPYIYSTDPSSNVSYTYKLTIGQYVVEFDRQYGSPVTSWRVKNGGQFSVTGKHTSFTYTAGDGTVTQFGGAEPEKFTSAYALWQEKPNGTRLTFHYDTSTSSSGSVPRTRLRLVTNNRGFGLGFVFFTGLNHTRLSHACAVNLTVSYANVSSPCPSGSPQVSYTYTSSDHLSGRLSGFTDLAGQTTQYSYTLYNNMISLLTGIRLPGSAVDDLTIAYNTANWKVTSRTYANGGTWSYAYQNNWDWQTSPHNEWTDVTDPLGKTTRHSFAWGAPPKPGSVTDPLNRTKQYRYATNATYLLWKEIRPDGGYVQHSYDNRDNRIETRLVAAPGSGLADIVSSASYVATPTYPYSCASPKTCNQPDYTIDANGNRTDYTYDPAHGGVLTETGPAVNGIRPQTRYEYAQRYAWIRNSAGAFVQAPTPVWLLTATSLCRSSAATGNPSAPCATSGDEVRTTYDYGPNSGPNNLLVRGQVVTSGGTSLRSCFGYDDRARRISETQPKASLTSCP